MDNQSLLVEFDGALARLTLNRPDSRNSLSPDLVQALGDTFESLRDNHDVHVICLTGAGDKAFCAGGDLGGSGMFAGDGILKAHHDRAGFSRLFEQMNTVGKPIVARLNGHALGGGFGLALAADIVIAADDVKLGAPEVNLGLFPMVIMATPSRNIPRKILMEMILTGQTVKAPEAARWGYINRAVPREDLDASVDATLKALLSKSPATMRLGRDTFYAIQDMDFESALKYLNAQLTINIMADDVMEGIAAFFEKREPKWSGK